MSTRLAYIAQPIDQGWTQGDGWRVAYRDIIKAARHCGWDLYTPAGAFTVGNYSYAGSHIDVINRAALNESSAVIAFLPKGVATLGTVVEIDRSVNAGKPVMIVTDIGAESVQLKAWSDYDNVHIVSDLNMHVADMLKTINWLETAIESLPPTNEPLIFQKHNDQAIIPTRGHADDAGYDLYTLKDIYVAPGAFVDVPTGVAVDLPDGLWGMITGRSSTLRARKLLVATGIIDNGYTGPLFAGCQNLSDNGVMIEAGERVAQMILLPTSALGFTAEWGVTRTKSRGSNGFGSTGR